VRRALATTVLFTLSLSVRTPYLVALAEGQTSATRVPMKEVAGKEVVQVSINGSGPYDFILDSGSNATMIRSDLARKLHLSDGAPIAIVTATGETRGYRIIAGSVAVGGLAAEHLEINALDQTRALTGRIQGVLGENFLRNFDVLLDYEQQTLIIDRTSSLKDKLDGERLSFSRFGNSDFEMIPNRIVIKLKVPSYVQKPLLFLVDTGAHAAMLYPSPGGLAIRAMQSSEHVQMSDLDGTRDCVIRKTSFEIGSGTFGGVRLVTCEGLTRNKMDTDGLLPTDVFRRFFISHRGGYVIANPRSLEKLDDDPSVELDRGR
jgi:hypothetical protein